MTNTTRVARSSIIQTLQKRGIIRESAERTRDAVQEHATPDAFTFKGIPLTYPFGPDNELLKGVRLERLNNALVANGNKPIPEHLANVATCKRAYEALYAKSKRDEYDPTPVEIVRIEHVTPRRRRIGKKSLDDLDAAFRELRQ